jgi:hypothetical protein
VAGKINQSGAAVLGGGFIYSSDIPVIVGAAVAVAGDFSQGERDLFYASGDLHVWEVLPNSSVLQEDLALTSRERGGRP